MSLKHGICQREGTRGGRKRRQETTFQPVRLETCVGTVDQGQVALVVQFCDLGGRMSHRCLQRGVLVSSEYWILQERSERRGFVDVLNEGGNTEMGLN